MSDPRGPRSPTPADLASHYASGYELTRLDTDSGPLERERARELIRRFAPPPPAAVVDVGGAGGTYGCWLAAPAFMAMVEEDLATGRRRNPTGKQDPTRRDHLLRVARAVETEPSLIGASAHLLAVGRRP